MQTSLANAFKAYVKKFVFEKVVQDIIKNQSPEIERLYYQEKKKKKVVLINYRHPNPLSNCNPYS